jgi:hypothetical protein
LPLLCLVPTTPTKKQKEGEGEEGNAEEGNAEEGNAEEGSAEHKAEGETS